MSDIVVNITPPPPIELLYTQGGAVGPQGAVGPAGPPNSLTVGTVATTSATTAAVSITGTAPSQVISFVVPRGPQGIQGIQGIQGDTGPANVLSVGTVATTSATTAAVSITGTAPSQVISFVVPRGPQGIQGDVGPLMTVQVGGVTTGASGTDAKVDAVTTGSTVTLNFTIPRGADSSAILTGETPQPLGVASVGSALTAARADHVHATLTAFPYASLTGIPTTFSPSAHTHTVSEVSGLQTALDSKQAAGSYATLDGSGKVPSSLLPSYIDDVIEYATLSSFPSTNDVGKIFTAIDTRKIYRWSGTGYVEISPSPGTTTDVPEGTNLYFTTARAAAAAPVQSVAGRSGTVTLTKSDVGLGNVDNTSDASKPVSTAQAAADTAVQSFAIQRSNHTGTQTASTISDFATEAAKYGPVVSVAGRTGTVTLAQLASSGTASATTFLRGDGAWAEAGSGDGSGYVLPTASASVLGGIKVGSGLAIASGVLSTTGGGGSGEDSLLRSIFVPAAPTGLAATAGDAKATLSWTAPTGVISQAPINDYRVQYSEDNGSTWTTLSRVASTATSVVVAPLTNDQPYVFQVAAVNAVGVGAYTASSGSVTPIADNSDPDFANVSLLLHLNSGFSDSSLVSNAFSGVTSSDISTSVKKFGGGSFALTSNVYKLDNPAAMQFGSVGTFTIECWVYPTSFPLTLWQTFTFTGGAGGHIASTDANGQLVVYERERYVVSTSSATQLALNSWQHVALSVTADAVSLYIEGARVATGSFTADKGSSGSDKCWIGGNIYGGVGGGYIDEFRVTKNIARYSGTTLTKPVSSFPDFGPPGAPTSLTATRGNAQIALAWTAPASNGGSAITGYRVEYTPSGGSPQTVSTGSTSTSYTLTGLTNGTEYAVRVAAVSAAGAGAYTASSSATPTDGTTPNAPTSLTAAAGNAQIALSWTAPSNPGSSAITGYRVQYTPSGGSPQTVSTGSTSTSYTLTGLTNGTSYTVRVAGVSSAGPGDYTASSSPVTPVAVTLHPAYGPVTGSGTSASPWVWQSGSGFSSGTTAKIITAESTVTLRATLTNTGGENCDSGESRSLGIYSAANIRITAMSSSPETISAGQYIAMELDCAHGRAEVWVA